MGKESNLKTLDRLDFGTKIESLKKKLGAIAQPLTSFSLWISD